MRLPNFARVRAGEFNGLESTEMPVYDFRNETDVLRFADKRSHFRVTRHIVGAIVPPFRAIFADTLDAIKFRTFCSRQIDS